MPVRLKRYAIVYVALAVGLAVLSVVLEIFLGISGSSGVSTVLPPMFAAMMEGQKAAEAGAAPYTKSEAWAEARRMTGVVIAINIVVAVGVMVLPDVREVVLSAPMFFVIALAVLFGVVLLVNRFALTWGYRQGLKAQSRRKGT